MKKTPDIGELIKSGSVSLDTVLDTIEKMINGLRKQIGQVGEEIRKEHGRLGEELRKISEDQAEIRREIDQLQKSPWPPRPNKPRDDTLRKKTLPVDGWDAATHSAPPRLM
jgi:hypothetical protein